VAPREVWDCPVDRFVDWLRQTDRIAEKIEEAQQQT